MVRHRRHTPDRQYQGQMRDVLKQRIDRVPAQISRGEVEEIGVEIGLGDPTDAVRLFDRLKGVSWRGDYVASGENGWVMAWVTEVN